MENGWVKYLMVGIGGGAGSILRFWIGSYIGGKMGSRFPYGTLVINVTGSFLMGLIFALLTARTAVNPMLSQLRRWLEEAPLTFCFRAWSHESLTGGGDGTGTPQIVQDFCPGQLAAAKGRL